ncbi:MAG TPA: anaerobic ribonucleoside-triphosphate reductase activating protein [Methanophagales archaeon]|nr:anaerobic ribonucleoside-triphosphate reductase activating protein [Methanophagales archaeon]
MKEINLGGTVPFSTIDWRGKAAMVIFLRGCPLRCIYCQNYNLLEGSNYVERHEIEEEIKKNEDFIDAVVISGGEPFMQPQAVEEIAAFAKRHSLFVAVQTNGFYPTVIKAMLGRSLIDKIFLDIKAPLSDEELYDTITKASGVAGRVKNTLAICGDAKIDLELITTVFKHLIGVEEVKRIAKDLEEVGAANCPYVIQQGRVELVPGNVIREEDVFSYEELKELAALAYTRLNDVRIRTREEGEEVIFR